MFPVAFSTYRKANENSVGGAAGITFFVVVVFTPDGVVLFSVDEVVTIGTSFNLSFRKTVNPAMGIVETFANFVAGVSVTGGVYPEILIGGVTVSGVVVLLPNGLNFEIKFVPVVVSPVVGVIPFWKYKNPTTAIIIITRIIAKSIKFLFDIKLFFTSR
ncbi:MAG TPA: hypothetical protein VGO21_03770 [Candidatus Paceibacterota bacterium]|jgi:hypothetical protein|nr:hypothetical protein [Candidatus Paceibacterota bacterium]